MADAFDPDKYLAEKRADQSQGGGSFDPDAYLAEKKALSAPASKPAQKSSGLMAALEHFGNKIALDYAPQLQAAAEPAMQKAYELGTGKDLGPTPDYLTRRDENIARMKQQEEDHPYISTAAKGAGIVTGAIASSGLGAGVKGASALQKILGAGKMGALYGALQNPGDKEGEVSPLQLGDRATNAAIGGAVGGTLGGVAEGIGAGLNKVGGKLKDFAEEKAFKSAGPMKRDFIKAQDAGKVNSLGRTLLDEGIVSPFSSPATVAERLEGKVADAGHNIGNILDTVDKFGSPQIDPQQIARELSESPDIAALSKIPGQEGAANKVSQFLETLKKNQPMSLREAQGLRQGVDEGINFNKAVPEMRGAQKHLYDIRDAIREKMNDAVNTYGSQFGDETKDVLLNANKRYSDLSSLERIASNRQAADSANRAFGLTDTIASGAGATVGASFLGKPGAAIGGLVGGGVNKLGRTYGSSLMATGADAISKTALSAGASSGAVARGTMIPATNSIEGLLQNYRNAKSQQPSDENESNFYKALSNNPSLIDAIKDPNLKEQLKKKIQRNPSDSGVDHPGPQADKYLDPKEAQKQFLEGTQ